MRDLYEKIPKLEFFDKSDLVEIETMAAGLTEDEILEYYGLSLSELVQFAGIDSEDSESVGEAPKESDLYWFRKAFKRGRAAAKIKATQKLFENMSDKRSDAALTYLRQMAEAWPKDEQSAGNGSFSFKIDMGD